MAGSVDLDVAMTTPVGCLCDVWRLHSADRRERRRGARDREGAGCGWVWRDERERVRPGRHCLYSFVGRPRRKVYRLYNAIDPHGVRRGSASLLVRHLTLLYFTFTLSREDRNGAVRMAGGEGEGEVEQEGGRVSTGGGPTVGTQHNTTHNNNTSMITVCRRVNSQRGARPGSLGVFLSE